MTEESPTPLPNVFDAVQQQMSRLVMQRDSLLRQLQEIEEKVSAIAEVLGIDPTTLASTAAAVPEPKIDGRRAGSMVEFMIKTVQDAEGGLTRGELKSILRASAEYGEKVRVSENGFYNAVMRLVRRGELEDVAGRLYGAGRAPAPGQDPFSNMLGLTAEQNRQIAEEAFGGMNPKPGSRPHG